MAQYHYPHPVHSNVTDNDLITWVDSQENEATESSNQLSSTRVCDRCMLKKIKCNLQRPACSRCLEEGIPCVYSTLKRKPGPAKGSRRKRLVNSADDAVAEQANSWTLPTPNLPSFHTPYNGQYARIDDSVQVFQTQAAFTTPQTPLSINHSNVMNSSTLTSVANSISPFDQGSQPLAYIDPLLRPDQEFEILNDFFANVSPSIPLFRRELLLHRYVNGLISRDLLITILAVSAKIQGLSHIWSGPSIDKALDMLMEVDIIPETPVNNVSALEQFQQACLIAFYQFHQYPGNKVWLRIGDLTRKAYQYGLHQIEDREHCQLYDTNSAMGAEAEEWRLVWWCIYCLDSYCNINASTPFVIDVASVKTALIDTSQVSTPNNSYQQSPTVFLSDDTDVLWKTVKEFTSPAHSTDYTFNAHIVTVTLLREAATIARLWKQNPTAKTRLRFSALHSSISAVGLALPLRFTNLARNASNNETASEHHARLICLIHIQAARLLTAMPVNLQDDEDEWRKAWARTLEYSEDIVSIIRQWNAQLSFSVDPAVCFIISAILIMLHLHSKHVINTDPDLQARIQTYRDLLLLFLEQFASIWHLPRYLIIAYHKFSDMIKGPLTDADIDQIRHRSQGPLHSSWMKYLSLNSDVLEPAGPAPQDVQIPAYFHYHDQA